MANNHYSSSSLRIEALESLTPNASDMQEEETAINVSFHYDKLSNGQHGPMLIEISPGHYQRGQLGIPNAIPVRTIEIKYSFMLGKYPVTVEEYLAYCDATSARVPKNDFAGNNLPVTRVNWREAKAYCAWLSRETGFIYRLPSETEWEYAARAHSRTQYWWGDNIGQRTCNCAVSGTKWSNRQASPIDAFKPNGFGVYDILGNVYEWTEDSWHDSYVDGPTNGKSWIDDESDYRVFRGGAWNDLANVVRSAHRGYSVNTNEFSVVGFRVLREI